MIGAAVFRDDETVSMLRESVATFARQNPGPERFRTGAAGSGFDRAAWRKMAEAGWLGLQVPEAQGGVGLGPRELAAVAEELGRALAPEPYAMLSVLALGALAACPEATLRDALLASALAGEATIALAWQETADQDVNVVPKVSATRDGQRWRLRGVKHFVDGGTSATDYLVTALADGNIALFAVPATQAGLVVNTRSGIAGDHIASLHLEDCLLDAERCLAPDASALLAGPLEAARLALAAELAGVAARALELTVEYTKQRVQFGKPIASFQSIQHRLVDMWTQAMLARSAVANAADAATTSPGSRTAALATLAAKARASDAAGFVCRNAVQLYGAMGYTEECDIGLYLKRAIGLGACLSGAERQRQLFLALEGAII